MRYLVTGGTGTIGSAVIDELLGPNYDSGNEVWCMSRDDTKQAELGFKHPMVRFLIGDVSDIRDCERVIYSSLPHIVIHCAALKHVPACEANIEAAVRINFHGTVNILTSWGKSALPVDKHRFVFISTDKSVNPVSVLGMTKYLAERFVHDFDGACTVRFGNVLASRGSILPIARRHLAEHGAVLLTSPEMSRYWIDAERAAKFIVETPKHPISQKLFVPQMVERKVIDVIREHLGDVPVKIVGARFGEKLREDIKWPWEA